MAISEVNREGFLGEVAGPDALVPLITALRFPEVREQLQANVETMFPWAAGLVTNDALDRIVETLDVAHLGVTSAYRASHHPEFKSIYDPRPAVSERSGVPPTGLSSDGPQDPDDPELPPDVDGASEPPSPKPLSGPSGGSAAPTPETDDVSVPTVGRPDSAQDPGGQSPTVEQEPIAPPVDKTPVGETHQRKDAPALPQFPTVDQVSEADPLRPPAQEVPDSGVSEARPVPGLRDVVRTWPTPSTVNKRLPAVPPTSRRVVAPPVRQSGSESVPAVAAPRSPDFETSTRPVHAGKSASPPSTSDSAPPPDLVGDTEESTSDIEHSVPSAVLPSTPSSTKTSAVQPGGGMCL